MRTLLAGKCSPWYPVLSLCLLAALDAERVTPGQGWCLGGLTNPKSWHHAQAELEEKERKHFKSKARDFEGRAARVAAVA